MFSSPFSYSCLLNSHLEGEQGYKFKPKQKRYRPMQNSEGDIHGPVELMVKPWWNPCLSDTGAGRGHQPCATGASRPRNRLYDSELLPPCWPHSLPRLASDFMNTAYLHTSCTQMELRRFGQHGLNMERGNCCSLLSACYKFRQFRAEGKAGSNLSVFFSSGNAQVGHLNKCNCGTRL